MSVYVLTQVSCYNDMDEISESKLCTRYTLRLTRKHIPVAFLSKESNKSLRIHLIRHQNTSGVGDLQSHWEPCPHFWAWCQHLYRLGAWRREVLTYTPLLSSLPIAPLPHEDLDWVLDPRKSSLPSDTPNSGIALKEEKERRWTSEWEPKIERTNIPPRDQGNQRKSQLLLTFLPFTKKTNSSAVIVNRLGVPELQVPHAREALPVASLPGNLTNTPPPKRKWSQPRGGTKLRALGHREFLAQASSLHNQWKSKQPYTAHHTPNTCVQEHRGRHGGYSLGARRPRVLGLTHMATASSPYLKTEKGEGPWSWSQSAVEMSHILQVHTCHLAI